MINLKPYYLVAALVAAAAPSVVAQQPKVKSPKELEAIQAIFNAQDADARIDAVENLLAKFKDTEYKAIALYIAAAAAQSKNDYEKMVVYAERTLEADPKSYATKLMLATSIPQRTKEFDLDKEEKLTRAENLAKAAMEDLKTAPKPRPDMPDEQWEAAKKDFVAQSHEALGLVAMNRKKYDVAVAEFKASVESGAQVDPATLVRLAASYNLLGKPDEALAVIDKLNAMPDVHPSIKQFAQAERVRALQAKGTPKAAEEKKP